MVAGWEEARSSNAAFAAAANLESITLSATRLADAEVARQRAFKVAGVGTVKDELAATLTANEKSIQVSSTHFNAVQAWVILMKATFTGG